MKTSLYIVTCALLFTAPATFSDTLYSSTTLGYSIYLPDHWVAMVKSDSQHCFYDTTNVYTSYLALIRYHRNAVDFATATQWTRANFIAYLMSAQYSFDPWGAVLYYDSLPTTKIGALWTPEAYTVFYSLDTTWGSWAEYQRFTASETFGYSLYAAGDTLDMQKNIGLYAAILATVEVPGSKLITTTRPRVSPVIPRIATTGPRMVFDPLGRKIAAASSAAAIRMPAGVSITSGKTSSVRIH
jgi:hypothetical protein